MNAGIVDVVHLSPSDFQGFIPKVLVKEGDALKCGSAVFCDKLHPEMLITSPVNGVVEKVVRGERRKILHVTIRCVEPDGAADVVAVDPATLTGDEIRQQLLTSGLWPYLYQRPYDVVANPTSIPRDIFISGFDTAPLAAESDFQLEGQGVDFQTGIDALTKLTQGSVYLSLPHDTSCKELLEARNVEQVFFNGKHPAGNVGVQINHIKPLNKGEIVWTLRVTEVLFIGRFFRAGIPDVGRWVALCGPGVRKPGYVYAVPGTPVSVLLHGNVYSEMHSRIISGNPLTGTRIDKDGCLSARDTSVTVLKEGDDIHEIFGWIMPRLDKFSMSRTYVSGFSGVLFPALRYEPDTRLMGGRRALIESGQYDKVFPMDILPEQLVRACITGNIEKQENLGIYEVAPEDFALCEYVCTSKVEVQKVVRQALDILRTENGDL